MNYIFDSRKVWNKFHLIHVPRVFENQKENTSCSVVGIIFLYNNHISHSSEMLLSWVQSLSKLVLKRKKLKENYYIILIRLDLSLCLCVNFIYKKKPYDKAFNICSCLRVCRLFYMFFFRRIKIESSLLYSVKVDDCTFHDKKK